MNGVSTDNRDEIRNTRSTHLRSVLNQCSAIAEKPNETELRGRTLDANGRLTNDEKTLFSSEGSCAASHCELRYESELVASV